MHCAACVGKVERALASVPGVQTAVVNLATERARVTFDPARVDFDALRASVAAAGYELAAPVAPDQGAAANAPAAAEAARAPEERLTRLKLAGGAALSV